MWAQCKPAALVLLCLVSIHVYSQNNAGTVKKGAAAIDIRSVGKVAADQALRPRVNGLSVPLSSLNISPAVVPSLGTALTNSGGNVLVNDPADDNIQIFPGTRPFVHATQSETAIVKAKGNLIAAYNSSANIIVAPNPGGPGLVIIQALIGAYSVSTDNGKTWSAAYFPPVPGSSFTFGDPALAVAPDGTAYFSQLGADAVGNSTVQVNKSTDGGLTWSSARVVAIDPGADKEWIAVGPDGVIYVTWTSFQNDGSSRLKLGVSKDGGNTWASRTIFAPAANPDPTFPQNAVQGSVPTVDPLTNTLYIGFVHFSNSDRDFIRILRSDNQGATFTSARFNIAGAPSPTVLPITQPGDLNECGAFVSGATEPFLGAPIAGAATTAPTLIPNVRLTIHTGSPLGGASLTGLPRWMRSSRLLTQPGLAARGGHVFLAWNNSNINVLGDFNAGSRILYKRSDDGGHTWTGTKQINPSISTNLYHVLPSLVVDEESDVRVAYYVQHTNGSVDVDLASSIDAGHTFPASARRRLTSTSFGLPPTNIPLPTPDNPFNTTNYDRLIQQCYALGEYLSVGARDQQVFAAWGDDRRLIQQPTSQFDPISGQVHPQEDVFFQLLLE